MMLLDNFRSRPAVTLFIIAFLSTLVSILVPSTAYSQTDAPDSHAPIGIMGDHLHDSGEFMFSYRYMLMQMENNLQGDKDISPEQIVSGVANRFANPPMMPPTLRVVPVEMSTKMHMLGMMYAPTDNITLMAMMNFIDKEMDHLTFQGPMGTNRLGEFTTGSNGLGDLKLGLLYGFINSSSTTLIGNLGLSLPTGDIEETGQILTPMGTRPTPRLPYPMQLGSGTYDLEPGITYKGTKNRLGWGSQLKYLMRLGENDEDYSLGNQLSWSNWLNYRFNGKVSGSIRISYADQDNIDGIDRQIAAPVQTADPRNQGGTRWDIGLGINTILEGNHRISLEYTNTVNQKVNGVQMKMEDMLVFGYQLAF